MSKTAAQYKDEGNAHLSAKRYDDAIESYTNAINLDSSDHVFYSNRSAAYLSKNDGQKAYEDGCKCIEVSPSWPKGYSRKGAALHALKRYEDAIQTFEDGLKVAPNDSSLQSGLNEVHKAKENQNNGGGGGGVNGLFGPQMLAKLANHPKFGPKLADPAFRTKLNMLQSNPQLIMADPDMMELLQALIGAGGLGGEGDDAMDDMPSPAAPSPPPPSSSSSSKSKPMEVDPEPLTDAGKAAKSIKDKANAAKDKGNQLYKEKKFPEAIACYEEAFSIDPTNIMYKNNLAAVYIEMNESDRAIQICNEALELGQTHRASYEDRAKVYQRIASAHLKKKDAKTAIKFYEKSQMENYDKAVERKIKTLELELKKAAIEEYINPAMGLEAKERGNTAFREGDFATAIKEYEEAIKRDPTNAPYRNNLAASYLKMGLFNDAKREVEKSLELDRNYVKAWAKKGDIELYMKEYHKAMDSYRAGLQIEPDNSLCKQGMRTVTEKINSASSETPDAERAQHAMADPEIQSILQDPMIRTILSDMQENPKYAQQALQDPGVRAKIEKLVAAGILQIK